MSIEHGSPFGAESEVREEKGVEAIEPQVSEEAKEGKVDETERLAKPLSQFLQEAKTKDYDPLTELHVYFNDVDNKELIKVEVVYKKGIPSTLHAVYKDQRGENYLRGRALNDFMGTVEGVDSEIE